ncbi:very short patch repair endonuclease [Motiliproteus sp.]|uniref:very short patch repair endonuclease n=1 Tax=Motiliproteus sp. TaxID=1898955 RepID=UPI003BAA5D51
MADIISKHGRAKLMSRIKSRDTQPEMVVRRYLHKLGFRYQLHRRDLPGKPDMVLPKYKAVIFVHGCFWHHHRACDRSRVPKTNQQFWQQKFDDNRKRDRRATKTLRSNGWRVFIVWECQLFSHNRSRRLARLSSDLKRF